MLKFSAIYQIHILQLSFAGNLNYTRYMKYVLVTMCLIQVCGMALIFLVSFSYVAYGNRNINCSFRGKRDQIFIFFDKPKFNLTFCHLKSVYVFRYILYCTTKKMYTVPEKFPTHNNNSVFTLQNFSKNIVGGRYTRANFETDLVSGGLNPLKNQSFVVF